MDEMLGTGWVRSLADVALILSGMATLLTVFTRSLCKRLDKIDDSLEVQNTTLHTHGRTMARIDERTHEHARRLDSLERMERARVAYKVEHLQ